MDHAAVAQANMGGGLCLYGSIKRLTRQITLEFKVHGQGKTLFGDGFAVWFTKEPSQEGPVFGSKDFFRGIGIFFDTYSNVRQVCELLLIEAQCLFWHGQSHQQYISVMVNQGTESYDHENDGGNQKLAGCHINFRDRLSHVRIVFDQNMLRLYTDVTDSGWNECFVVRQVGCRRIAVKWFEMHL